VENKREGIYAITTTLNIGVKPTCEREAPKEPQKKEITNPHISNEKMYAAATFGKAPNKTQEE
jgi:hypothetical protein